MPSPARRFLAAILAAAAIATPAAAQQQRAGVVGELLKDVSAVETKFVSLAKATPADKFAWRPDSGTRSIGEVFLHIAADNYLLPSALGVQPDPATGIKSGDFKTATAYEKRTMPRDSVIASLEASFAHLRKAISDTPDEKLEARISFFGQEMTGRQLWLATTGHLHEHLGQMIAYARMNRVVPPWSRPGS
jgi:uncharacterized damage-inducible protein DinB